MVTSAKPERSLGDAGKFQTGGIPGTPRRAREPNEKFVTQIR